MQVHIPAHVISLPQNPCSLPQSAPPFEHTVLRTPSTSSQVQTRLRLHPAPCS
ncbi:unnamed protein product [Penicillium camemberti]|uniref:Str. FM013 n=1 Tax=Penicillium camemberti (strain FM 013) TaxID=1429867 RepID=A0A0G4P3W9_PENC3|nr:unnamed protein product [Penicillium camemberti]